jgi:hypothetical protein
VTLLATATGVLDYSWQTEGQDSLNFFGLADAPGRSATLLGAVPEPITACLLTLGIAGLTFAGRRRR